MCKLSKKVRSVISIHFFKNLSIYLGLVAGLLTSLVFIVVLGFLGRELSYFDKWLIVILMVSLNVFGGIYKR